MKIEIVAMRPDQADASAEVFEPAPLERLAKTGRAPGRLVAHTSRDTDTREGRVRVDGQRRQLAHDGTSQLREPFSRGGKALVPDIEGDANLVGEPSPGLTQERVALSENALDVGTHLVVRG